MIVPYKRDPIYIHDNRWRFLARAEDDSMPLAERRAALISILSKPQFYYACFCEISRDRRYFAGYIELKQARTSNGVTSLLCSDIPPGVHNKEWRWLNSIALDIRPRKIDRESYIKNFQDSGANFWQSCEMIDSKTIAYTRSELGQLAEDWSLTRFEISGGQKSEELRKTIDEYRLDHIKRRPQPLVIYIHSDNQSMARLAACEFFEPDEGYYLKDFKLEWWDEYDVHTNVVISVEGSPTVFSMCISRHIERAWHFVERRHSIIPFNASTIIIASDQQPYELHNGYQGFDHPIKILAHVDYIVELQNNNASIYDNRGANIAATDQRLAKLQPGLDRLKSILGLKIIDGPDIEPIKAIWEQHEKV